MGFLRYMRGSIGKRLTVKHLTTVCLQSDKGQVKQLSLYSHTVFFATLRRTLRATVHFGAHTWESGVIESIVIVHSVTSMLCISSLTDTPDRSATKEKCVPC